MIRHLKFQHPMLAKELEGQRQHIVYPCYAQPKLDGVRCITDGRRFWSRNGNEFPRINTGHLRVPVLPYLVDGELMLERGDDFEDIVSIVKREGHERSVDLCFHAFDIILDEQYAQRRTILRRLFVTRRSLRDAHWYRVVALKALTEPHLYALHHGFLALEYEGTIVRNAAGLYVSRRTHDLLKWKPIKDKEFPIEEVVEAKGKDKGTPVFICSVDGDLDTLFRVRPMGTTAQRQKMWRERRKLIHKMLTVEYQNLTKYGIPRFPRAKVLRDYE